MEKQPTGPTVRRLTVRRKNVSKAKKRAEEEEGFFTGEEALQEVAKDDGKWNWALIGPDHQELPLSAGGSNGIDEIRSAFAMQAHSFGLLRMSFGVEPEAITKWLFVHTVDESNSGNFSRMERGQAAAKAPQMEEALRKFVPYSAKIDLHSPEECTAENLIAKLLSGASGQDAGLLTVEKFHAAVTDWLDKHPELQVKEKRKLAHMKYLQEFDAPRAEIAAPEAEVVAQTDVPSLRRQRTKMKLFQKGDVVEVFSTKHNKWYLDAEVVDVLSESSLVDSIRVSAGSMKVVYDNGQRFKWVAPHEMEALVRESPRPRPPEPLIGDLQKEGHIWFITRWQACHVELQKGFLQWWGTKEEAEIGKPAWGSIYLLGLQQHDRDNYFKVRSEQSNGALYHFMAEDVVKAVDWVEAMWVHAGYCEEVAEYYEAKLGGVMVRHELMNVMMRREIQSVSTARARTKSMAKLEDAQAAGATDGGA